MTALPDHPHHVGERVQLLMDVPNFGLQTGEVGTVCSIWELASDTYEVEFSRGNKTYPIRALLTGEQIETDESKSA